MLEKVGVGTLVAVFDIREGKELLFGVKDMLRHAGQANGFILLDGVDLESNKGRFQNLVREAVLAERVHHVEDPRELERVEDTEAVGLVVLRVGIFLHPPGPFILT